MEHCYVCDWVKNWKTTQLYFTIRGSVSPTHCNNLVEFSDQEFSEAGHSETVDEEIRENV